MMPGVGIPIGKAVSGSVRWSEQMDQSFAQGIVMSGQFPRDHRWVGSILGYVGNWGEANKIHLMAQGHTDLSVLVRTSGNRVRSVQYLAGGSSKVFNRLGALDACIQFAFPVDAVDCGMPPTFRCAVSNDTTIARIGGDLDWSVDQFCIALFCLFDVVYEELPQISSGIGSRRLKMSGAPQDVLCCLESEGEKMLIEALWADLQLGGTIDVHVATQKAGISARTASALLSRLWRMGALSDRS